MGCMTVAMLSLNGKIYCLIDILDSDNRKNRHHKLVLNEIVIKIGFANNATDFIAYCYADFFKQYLSISANAVAINNF